MENDIIKFNQVVFSRKAIKPNIRRALTFLEKEKVIKYWAITLKGQLVLHFRLNADLRKPSKKGSRNF